MNEWKEGIPPKEDIDEDNEYCYALVIFYDKWWLSNYLFKANHEEGCFECILVNDEKKLKFPFGTVMWQRIETEGINP